MEGFGPLEIYPTKISFQGAAVENEIPQWFERTTLVDPEFSPSLSWTNFRIGYPKSTSETLASPNWNHGDLWSESFGQKIPAAKEALLSDSLSCSHYCSRAASEEERGS
jgi:hypothetical protein